VIRPQAWHFTASNLLVTITFPEIDLIPLFNPKADIPQRRVDVCFVPIADIEASHSITSSAVASSAEGDIETPVSLRS
jgi:hypothetical protein